jgi:tetratricopeptide (TPR) repeat protein
MMKIFVTGRRLLLVFAIGAAALGSSGCQYFSWLHPHLKAKAVAAKMNPATLAPAGPNALLDRLYADAVHEIEHRDYASALDLLQMARARKADDPRVLTAMGVIYDKLGRFDLSDRYYTLAEAADPGSKVVAMDRAYSQRLQRAGEEVEAAAGETAFLARIETDPPVTTLARLDTPAAGRGDLAGPARLPDIIREGRLAAGVEVRDATGEIGGADPIKARLTRAGWSLGRLPVSTPLASPVTRIDYPGDYARVARALARTLPIPATLRECDDCRRLEVVVGRDMLAKPVSHASEARAA